MATHDDLPDAAIAFRLNGAATSAVVASSVRLSDVLRSRADGRDVKVGCNAGDCGACTVLIDGAALCACLTATGQVAGKDVRTVAGLVADDPVTGALARAFLRHGAAQCGICTPGMLVSATALLRRRPHPDEREVTDALGGVLCRCTGYRKIIEAVRHALDTDDGLVAANGVDANDADADGIGVSVPRLDGVPKVSGTERFGDDVAPLDALVLKVVRSPHHHATFAFGDLDAWVAGHDGIERVLTARDVPGLNRFGVIPPFIDQPVFAEHRVRFRGEAVAAVIGSAAAAGAFDEADFPVSWTELPAVLTPAAALADGVVPLHTSSPDNVLCEGFVRRGDADAALADAHLVVAGEFETGFVEHAYLEPEAGYARRVGERVEVHGCTQAAYMNRDVLAAILGLEPAAVRVVPSAVGGGFGSKLDLSWQPFVALAAWHLRRPVRLTYTRRESMQSSTKRHPASMHARIGADADGRVRGMTFEGTFNTGAYASWGPTVANRVPIHASGPYLVPHYRARARGVYTHCAPAGAFRGFGVPQAAIAQESLYDELATALGIDRLEFRVRNALADGQPTVTGQVFGSAIGIGACLEAMREPWRRALEAADDANGRARAVDGPLRRGVGIASGWYGCGNTSLPNPSTMRAGVRADGTVCLHQGAIDLGQGSGTVIPQIFAETLGVPVRTLVLLGADTDLTPDAGKTSASRQTFVSGNAAKRAAEALRDDIARRTNCASVKRLAIADGGVVVNGGLPDERRIDLAALPPDADGYVLRAEAVYDPPTKPLDADGQGDPYALFGYAAQLVELSVDIRLGTVALHRVVAAHDVGRAINPQLVEGQIHGGVAQGIGMALMEAFVPGRSENLHDYLIPTIGDVPPIESILVEVPDPEGPGGAKGLGEHVLVPTAPAILNAVAHASGGRVRQVPATPERVLAAIREGSATPSTACVTSVAGTEEAR